MNSYKRLVAGGEAPTYLSWGARNRSTLVRIPRYRPDREVACRVELRSPDPAANPYLAFAVMLAAGLKGIEDGLELQPPTEDQDLFCLSRQDLRAQGMSTLPESLGEAVELFAASDLMRETLGRAHPRLPGEREARRLERLPRFRDAVGARSLPGGAVAMRGGREG